MHSREDQAVKHRRRIHSWVAGLMIGGMLTAAASPTSAQVGSPVASSGTSDDRAERVSLTVGLGYIPSVQFAPFYLADQAGYYADAGLDVTFQHHNDQDLITLLGQGTVDVGMADGTSLIPAVSQGIPIVYVATVFSRFPNVVFAPVAQGITSAADLAGHSVGVPGRYGSSWIALQALLASAGLTPEDVEILTYPDFGHGVAVAAGQVDSAVGYLNNEPVTLRREGIDVDVVSVDEVAPLPGPGLVVNQAALREDAPALRGFTSATLRAMADISADPQSGLDATFARVPELAGEPDLQEAILEATVEAWSNAYTDAHGLGSIDPAVWASALDTMRSLPDSVVPQALEVSDLIDDSLLP
jgi:NitT/TauT family transport system substrate-binding protein